LTVSRRRFLASAAGSAVVAAAEMGLFEFAASLWAGEPTPAGQPRVQVVYVRPEKEPIVSWPGGNCDVPAQQALFTRTLQAAASQLGVQLQVREQPLTKAQDVPALLEQLRQSPPEGLIVVAMSLGLWAPVNEIVEKRGPIPTIVYSNVSGFTQNLQCGRKTPLTILGATQEVQWLATALRMLHTLWRLKHTRILVLDEAGPEVTLAPWGTVLQPIPKARFQEAWKQAQQIDTVRAIANFYVTHAQRIVEPSKHEILDAARNYVVCRDLLAAEHCHGISIACLGWTNPVCLAFSKLLDEGIVAACEADHNAILSELLALSLLARPGFIQDPSPNTVNNTLIGAHCTSPIRLDGVGEPYQAPYWLRSYHTRTGCSLQVLWPVGKEVTVLQANAASPSIFAGTGRVRSNIAQPPSGCCRTAVEIELAGVGDTRDVKGFHQLFILGNFERTLQAFGQLAGIKVEPLA
jgi:hypothetical protein